jgi:hypothetical protein
LVGEGDVVVDNVGTTDFEDRQLDVEVGDTFDVPISHYISAGVPLDYHFSNILSMGWLLNEAAITLSSTKAI